MRNARDARHMTTPKYRRHTYARGLRLGITRLCPPLNVRGLAIGARSTLVRPGIFPSRSCPHRPCRSTRAVLAWAAQIYKPTT